MVRDGYYYGLVLIAAAVIVGWLASPAWATIPVLLAIFFLWFFRDPERVIPNMPGAVVSPGDGKVTDVSLTKENGEERTRISIFLSVFDVHVNRSPIGGVLSRVSYQKGKFLNAMNPASAERNEQNTITVRGQGSDAGFEVTFKQIAGLLARRIVFGFKEGQTVARGQRVGLIKFGSRVDVVLPGSATLRVRVGERVKGGASILAEMPREKRA